MGIVVLLGGAGCQEQRPAHPVGRWEFVGLLPDGSRGIVRVEIQPGPFVKYLGFREHMEPLAPAHAQQLTQDLERRWRMNPEMLLQFEEGWFRGYGGDTDGEPYFFWEQETNTLVSAREDSLDRRFLPVEKFTEFVFPVRLPAGAN